MSQFPSNPEAERTCLGAAFLDPEAVGILAALLPEQAFHGTAHREIYKAMLSVHDRGGTIDFMSVSREMGEGLDKVGGLAVISALCDGLPRITNVDQWAHSLLNCYWRRQLIALGARLSEASGDYALDVHELISGAGQQLEKIQADTGGSVVSLAEVLPQSVKQIESFVSSSGRSGISTGWEEVDRATGGGLCGGRMYFIAARSGRGKSSCVLQWVARAAAKGARVLIFATEMVPEDVGERLLCHQGGTDKWAIFKDEVQWARVSLAMGEMQDWPIWIDRRETPTIGQISATCRQFKLKHGLDLVVVDHVQRLNVESTKEGRWLGVGLAVQGLKSLSMRLGVPVLVTSQLATGEDENKRPNCGMLAQSRQMIEAESDVIGFLHPTSRDWRDELETEIEFFLEKSRHGRCASWTLGWHKPTHTMRMRGRTGR